jgi:hypothetical protein
MRKLGLVGIGILACSLSLSGNARAWDDFGHMEVAAAAFKKLKPKAKTRVAQLLKLNPRYANWIVGARKVDEPHVAFMRAATWADAIKSDRAYKDDDQGAPTAGQNVGYSDLLRHRFWHYVDRPFSRDGTPLVDPAVPNLATQIPALRTALCSTTASEDLKSYDLVWLLHLVGDAHQPLHCVSRFDKAIPPPSSDHGGNLVKVTGNVQPSVCDDPRFCPFGPPEDLHAFYDDITGSGYSAAEVDRATSALPSPNAQRAGVADVDAWIEEGFDLAQSAIYVSPINAGVGPFPIDPAYQKAAVTLGKQRISLAGARLANLLNQCLAK